MPEKAQTPGALLRDKLEKLGLPVYTVAKEMQISNALLYYIMNEKGPISVAAALRFAKYFNTTPEYWLTAQMKYDLEQAAKDKELQNILKGINRADKKKTLERLAALKQEKKAAKAADKAKTVKPANKTGIVSKAKV